MMFFSHNVVVPAILAQIDRDGETTVRELFESLGFGKRHIEATLNKMMQAQMIHVARYERIVPGSGKPARVFVAGPGQNAIMPKRNSEQRRKANAAWCREYRARQALINRAQGMGPFGIVAAQMMGARA